MTNIVICSKDGNILADGVLGTEVFEFEDNYYFVREAVRLEVLLKQENSYTCPEKKATCDYYYTKNETGGKVSRQCCWIYEDIKKPFKEIEGIVGFYGHSTGEVDLEILD